MSAISTGIFPQQSFATQYNRVVQWIAANTTRHVEKLVLNEKSSLCAKISVVCAAILAALFLIPWAVLVASASHLRDRVMPKTTPVPAALPPPPAPAVLPSSVTVTTPSPSTEESTGSSAGEEVAVDDVPDEPASAVEENTRSPAVRTHRSSKASRRRAERRERKQTLVWQPKTPTHPSGRFHIVDVHEPKDIQVASPHAAPPAPAQKGHLVSEDSDDSDS